MGAAPCLDDHIEKEVLHMDHKQVAGLIQAEAGIDAHPVVSRHDPPLRHG